MSAAQRKRLTITFNRAVLKPWEEFEILLPSSERDGYKWILHQQASQPFEITKTQRFPDYTPRACLFTLAASQYGTFNVEARLSRPEGNGAVKTLQTYKFKVVIK